MRIVCALFLVTMICACKSKIAIPADQLLQYVVILEEGSTPKMLEKEIPFEIIDFLKKDTKINLWEVTFNGQSGPDENLKKALLNHPKVISVLTLEEYNKIQNKKNRKPMNAPHGKGGVGKQ